MYLQVIVSALLFLEKKATVMHGRDYDPNNGCLREDYISLVPTERVTLV